MKHHWPITFKTISKMYFRIFKEIHRFLIPFSEAPGLMNSSAVETLQLELVDALRLELKHNHPKEKYLLPQLLLLVPQLIQVTEELKSQLKGHLFDDSEHFSSTHELLCEIFDLCWKPGTPISVKLVIYLLMYACLYRKLSVIIT